MNARTVRTGLPHLAAELRARIAAGLYPDGVRLPPRPNSPPNSGLSRQTVRRAFWNSSVRVPFTGFPAAVPSPARTPAGTCDNSGLSRT